MRSPRNPVRFSFLDLGATNLDQPMYVIALWLGQIKVIRDVTLGDRKSVSFGDGKPIADQHGQWTLGNNPALVD